MSKFRFEALEIPGPLLIRTRRFGDSRGHFTETYSAPAFADGGIDAVFVQDNQSLSIERGTVRGLHFQRPPLAQAKLVRALRGAICDVAVDIRTGSPTFGRCCVVTLTAESGDQLLVPRGFAHGFCTLEPNTEIAYKVDSPYSAEHEQGIFWADRTLAIPWPVAAAEAVVSQKDGLLPRFAELVSPFRLGE